ncbi:MAG: glycosyltransferase family 4 protein [Candidatus Binataceae bacterium]
MSARLSKIFMTRGKAAAQPPWVIVAGGFHAGGAMDRANAALARHLRDLGVPLHLVSYQFDADIGDSPAIATYRVKRPVNSAMLGKWSLERTAWTVAARVMARTAGARVVVNGGNCIWPDINWVHYIHRASQFWDEGAPLWFKTKNRIGCLIDRRRELLALRNARVVLANSDRTRADLISLLGLEPQRVHTVYLGAEPSWMPADANRRLAARAWLGKPARRPLVAFIGALGYDNRKGFDRLMTAWRRLCARPEWDADLIAAGGGRALASWRREVAEAGLGERVTMLGFTSRVTDLLAAADLLVSPVRYEAYGVNVQEALCAGVPAMVTRATGIAERYPAELSDLLLDRDDADSLAARLLRWRADMNGFRNRAAPLGRLLRSQTLGDMAAQIVAIVESTPPSASMKNLGRRMPQWLSGHQRAS